MSAPDRAAETPAPSPSVLWYAAEKAHPDDVGARTARYLELMREAGHIIQRDPDDDSPVFSCSYDQRAASESDRGDA